MEKKKKMEEKLNLAKLKIRLYLVMVLLLAGIIIDFVDLRGAFSERAGFFARYAGVLALAVYSVFFITQVPESKAKLKAMAKASWGALFVFLAAGFVLMVAGQGQVLSVKFSTLMASASLLLLLAFFAFYMSFSRS